MYEITIENDSVDDSDPLDTIETPTPERKEIKMSKNKGKIEKYKKQAMNLGLTYSKVIMPLNMRSRYWKYFGFPADENGDIISKDYIVCSLCNTPMHFHKNTTNLRSHLQRHHKDVLLNDDEDYKPLPSKKNHSFKKESSQSTSFMKNSILPLKKIKIEQTLNSSSKLAFKKPKKLTRMDTLLSPLGVSSTNVSDETPVLESDILDSTEQISTEVIEYQQYDTNNTEQQQQHHDHKGSFAKSSSSSSIQLKLTHLIQQMITTDLFPTSITEGAGFSNLIWTICGIVPIPQKKEIEMSINKLYEEKNSNLIQTLQNHSVSNPFSLGIEIWHNNEKKTLVTIYFNYVPRNAVTTFNTVLFTTVELSKYTNLEEIFQGIHLKNCSAAVINSYNNIIASFLAVYDIPSVNCFDAVIQRCMKSVFNLPEISTMFSEIHDLFYKHSDILPDASSLPRIDDSYPWTKYNFLKYFLDNVTFQDEENDLLLKTRTVLECLQPFKLTLETLIDEPNAVCSLIKPLAYKLVEQHFQPKNGDYELAGQIKDIVGKELRQSLLSNTFLIISSFLDPRFHSFINENEIGVVHQLLNNKAAELLEKVLSSSSSSTTNETNSCKSYSSLRTETTDVPKKSSIKLFFDDTQRTQTQTSNLSIQQEIMKYRTEVFTDLEQCPLDWWSKMGFSYPQMRIVADQYKCIPCCSSNSFKRTVEEQIDFNNRRSMLRGHSLNQILFLHYNKKYLD